MQPNNLGDVAGMGAAMPMPLPFGGLGGLLPDMPSFDLPFPMDLPKLLKPFEGQAPPPQPHGIFGKGFGGSKQHTDGLDGPFKGGLLGGAFGGAFGDLSIGHLGKGVQSEQVAEEIRTRPDGTVCKCLGGWQLGKQ